MVRRVAMWAVVGAVLALTGCGLSFRPVHEGQTYPQTVKIASRISHPGPSSCEIGVIVMNESFDNNWERIARTAAENGGTHYYVRTKYGAPSYVTYGTSYRYGGFAAGSSRTYVERDEHNVIVVYRHEDETCELSD